MTDFSNEPEFKALKELSAEFKQQHEEMINSFKSDNAKTRIAYLNAFKARSIAFECVNTSLMADIKRLVDESNRLLAFPSRAQSVISYVFNNNLNANTTVYYSPINDSYYAYFSTFDLYLLDRDSMKWLLVNTDPKDLLLLVPQGV